MLKNLSKVYSAELEGIDAKLIEVEVDLNIGLHSFNIVGLADKALNEAKERVNSALKNSNIKPPNRENRRITVNLAPADIKKTGSHYDLAIAVGYLLATKQISDFDANNKIFVGELALDGRTRPIHGALNIAQMAREKGFEYLYIPPQNANEAAVIDGLKVIPIETLSDLILALENRKFIKPKIYEEMDIGRPPFPDLSEIKGQEHAKRALIIAAAGGHNMLMVGPPGVGKSLLAQSLVGILPDLSKEESIEITKIYSATGLSKNTLITQRPIRSPHQTSSIVSIIGGGTNPKPGEVSLSHRGVLFLDEFPEFPRNILESLRQPMESGTVNIARAKNTLSFPAKFSLIAAMNPCPCGFYGDEEKECKCSAYEIIKYWKKVSGPLLDRIDLQIKVKRVKIDDIRKEKLKEPISGEVKSKIEKAREIQAERFSGAGIKTNSEMSSKQVEQFVRLEPEAEEFLKQLDKHYLSPRGYYRLLKTSQTIADIEGSAVVKAEYLAEAFSYRLKED